MGNISSNEESITDDYLNINVRLKKTQSLKISDDIRIRKPSFIAVASGYSKEKGMDYTKELLKMTPQEGFVFNILMDNRVTPDALKPYIKSNESFIDNSRLTPAEKKKVYVGYTRLREKDLVVRLGRGRYMINPNLVITHDMYFHKDLATYEQAVDKLKPEI